MLASLNKGTAALLVSATNPTGIEIYSYAKAFFVLFVFVKDAHGSYEWKHSMCFYGSKCWLALTI